MDNQLIVDDQRKTKPINSILKIWPFSFLISGLNSNNDHSRRLIQTAYVCFQQLNECEDLNHEQRQWIQTWMDSVSNVRFPKHKKTVIKKLIFNRNIPKIYIMIYLHLE